MDKEAIRREFEAWFEPDEDNRASLKNWRHGDGYLHSATYLCGCWEGYQAAYLSRDELVRELCEALQEAKDALLCAQSHHTATSLPLCVERFGSMENAGLFGRETWRKSVPNAINRAVSALKKARGEQ